MKTFEVVCRADAEITERWRVTAIDEEHAEERLLGDDSRGGEIEFLDQISCDHEENRRIDTITEVVRDPDTKQTKYACPSCGDDKHLYDRADVRWDPEAGDWVVGDTEGTLDCTECDWTGYLTEAEVKTDD